MLRVPIAPVAGLLVGSSVVFGLLVARGFVLRERAEHDARVLAQHETARDQQAEHDGAAGEQADQRSERDSRHGSRQADAVQVSSALPGSMTSRS